MNFITNTLTKVNTIVYRHRQSGGRWCSRWYSSFEADDVYEDFYKDKNLLDFSYYPQDSKFFNPVDKKGIGKLKDEFKGKIITEFIRLKSKIYTLIAVDGGEIKKAKAVNKNVVENIGHKEFVDVLFNKKM